MRIDNLNSNQYLNKAYNIPSHGRSTEIGHDSIQNRQPGHGSNTFEQESKLQESKQQSKRTNASLNNVAISLGNRDSSLVGLGNLGGVQSNIMKNAVSQMQKDSILHEYQYFVGNGANNLTGQTNSTDSNILTNDADGVVIRKN